MPIVCSANPYQYKQISKLDGRLRRRLEDNIKMDLKEVGRGAWIGSFCIRIGTRGGNL
jgi:hypothetical protein